MLAKIKHWHKFLKYCYKKGLIKVGKILSIMLYPAKFQKAF